MAKIYLPDNLYNQSCKVINNDYIRVYTNSNNTTWTDVYFKNDYMLKYGSSNYTNTVVCDNLNTYTNDFYYRYDFPSILFEFIIIAIIGVLLPIKIFSRLFTKGGL